MKEIGGRVMKKVLSILLVITMVFVSFTGCSQQTNEQQFGKATLF